MEIKTFKKTYGLELIPAAHAGLIPGELVWDPLLGPPRFAHRGMPNTIYTAFLDAGLFEESDYHEIRESAVLLELQKAHFADQSVQVDTHHLGELVHPGLGKLKGELALEKVRKFSFSQLEVKAMNDMLRIRIDEYLEIMKANHWQEYDGKIRRVYMVTELYYGTMNLVVENHHHGAVEAALEKSRIQPHARATGLQMTEYSFSHDDVPFAMRIERVRSFNG